MGPFLDLNSDVGKNRLRCCSSLHKSHFRVKPILFSEECNSLYWRIFNENNTFYEMHKHTLSVEFLNPQFDRNQYRISGGNKRLLHFKEILIWLCGLCNNIKHFWSDNNSAYCCWRKYRKNSELSFIWIQNLWLYSNWVGFFLYL